MFRLRSTHVGLSSASGYSVWYLSACLIIWSAICLASVFCLCMDDISQSAVQDIIDHPIYSSSVATYSSSSTSKPFLSKTFSRCLILSLSL